MKDGRQLDKLVIKYILFIAVVVLALLNYQTIFSFINTIWLAFIPITIGAMLAYVLNIIMRFIERYYFPESKNPWVKRSRRPVSLFGAIIVVILVIAFVLNLVIPQLVDVIMEIVDVIPLIFEELRQFIIAHEQAFPPLADAAEKVNWQDVVSRIVSVANELSSKLIGSTLSTLGSTVSFVVNGVLSLMIAIYILMSKEKLGQQFKRVASTYLPRKWYDRLIYVMTITDESFTGFITGQLIEALVVGILVTLGMMIFQFPYATMMGALTGVTALIPVLGAYISGVVGFLLIFVQSPIQALAFIVFITILQQLEGNLIYPKVVGDQLGLPGIWVLVSITVGGALLGLTGMLISVPIAASLYKLLKNDVVKRENIARKKRVEFE